MSLVLKGLIILLIYALSNRISGNCWLECFDKFVVIFAVNTLMQQKLSGLFDLEHLRSLKAVNYYCIKKPFIDNWQDSKYTLPPAYKIFKFTDLCWSFSCYLLSECWVAPTKAKPKLNNFFSKCQKNVLMSVDVLTKSFSVPRSLDLAFTSTHLNLYT